MAIKLHEHIKTTLNKMAISKFWLDVFGEVIEVGEGELVALHELFWSSYHIYFYKKSPGLKKKQYMCPHRCLLRQRYHAASDILYWEFNYTTLEMPIRPGKLPPSNIQSMGAYGQTQSVLDLYNLGYIFAHYGYSWVG